MLRRCLSVAVGAMLLGTCFGLAGAIAQAPSPDEAQRKLEENKHRLDERQRLQKGLEGDVDALSAEWQDLNQRLLETAQLIQSSEGRLTGIEARRSELEEHEKLLKGSLEQRHAQIAHLLAAMQRMGRNPPPVIITQRQDALKMVRSAMMLAAAFPEMREQAFDLAKRLTELAGVVDGIKKEGDKLKTETDRLNESRTRLATLMETKRQSLTDRKVELAKVRREAAEIARNVSDLSELIGKLDRAVAAHTGLGAYEQRDRAGDTAVAPPVPTVAPAPATAPSGPTQTDVAPTAPTGPLAMAPPTSPVPTPIAPKAPERQVERAPTVELAPKGIPTSFNPGRMKPAIPFPKAKGQLPLPAQGKRIIGFGDRTQVSTSKGIVIETRYGAQVTSPCDGWIVYAGEFRSYGQLLIINAGDGYHILLAGMSQIDVQLGQFVLAGEPVGVMSGAPRAGPTKVQDTSPVLYVEFRKGDDPVNPDPWWAGKSERVPQ